MGGFAKEDPSWQPDKQEFSHFHNHLQASMNCLSHASRRAFKRETAFKSSRCLMRERRPQVLVFRLAQMGMISVYAENLRKTCIFTACLPLMLLSRYYVVASRLRPHSCLFLHPYSAACSCPHYEVKTRRQVGIPRTAIQEASAGLVAEAVW